MMLSVMIVLVYDDDFVSVLRLMSMAVVVMLLSVIAAGHDVFVHECSCL